MPGLAADLVAGIHLAAVFFLLTGGLLAWRWPRLRLVHLPLAVGILVVNLVGADCPLTTLELHLRHAAAEPGYSGGFVDHYLVRPFHPAGVTPTAGLLLYALAILPNVLAYGLPPGRHAAGARPPGAPTTCSASITTSTPAPTVLATR